MLFDNPLSQACCRSTCKLGMRTVTFSMPAQHISNPVVLGVETRDTLRWGPSSLRFAIAALCLPFVAGGAMTSGSLLVI